MAVGVGVGTRRGQGHCVGVDEAIVVGRGRGGERGRGHCVDCERRFTLNLHFSSGAAG